MNKKFLEEAKECTKKWEEMGLFKGIKKLKNPGVLLESCRFRYEYETDEEYEAYLKDFNERTKIILGQSD